jgi:hypothetical protein
MTCRGSGSFAEVLILTLHFSLLSFALNVLRCDTLNRRSVALGVRRLCRPQPDPSRHGDDYKCSVPDGLVFPRS